MLLLSCLSGLIVQAAPGTREPAMTEGAAILPYPREILDPEWLPERMERQLATAGEFDAFIDFSFEDRYPETGITWINRVVDDSGMTYKAVHYDHGNGMAIADVDGDGFSDIYFTNQIGSNALYRNLGDGTFEEITGDTGLTMSDRVSVSASFADIDNDGDPDLFVTAVRDGNKLFENQGDGTFEDITQESWLGHHGHSSGAVFFDYDRDGFLDLLVTNVGEYTDNQIRTADNNPAVADREPGTFHFYNGHEDGFHGHLKPWRAEKSILYRNQGDSTFKDVTEETGLIEPGWNGDASPIDVNNDGWIDLYITDMQGHDEYWENQQGEGFVKKTPALFPKTPWGAMGIEVFDWDQDGDFDIYLTDMHSDMSKDVPPVLAEEKQKADMQFPESYLRSNGKSIFGNAFFENNGDGTFTEVSQEIGAENYWPWGLSIGDLNADGYEDAFVVSSMNINFRYHPNTLLINDGGKMLRDAEFLLGVEPRAGGRTAIPWFELDVKGEDSAHEIAQSVARMDPEVEHVSVWGALGGRSSVIFDIEGDGDLDIVTNDFHSEPTVMFSNLTDVKSAVNYLKIDLEGTVSNRDGLGAVVRVKTGEKTWTQVYDGKSGYLSQSSWPLYFGLGDATTVDSISVEWPSGTIQTVDGPIEGNQTLTIEEDPGAPPMSRATPDPTPPDKTIPLEEIAAAFLPAASSSSSPEELLVYNVYPGQSIQAALDAAARRIGPRVVRVHEGLYRPQQPGQAFIWLNAKHAGINVEAVGDVTLTAANPEVADPEADTYPAIVNHVVYFGDGIGADTVFRGFRITGANGFVTRDEEPGPIQPDLIEPRLQKALFFYTDGGGIKIFGRSYPVIEACVIEDNYTEPCGAGVSVEHRGYIDKPAVFRHCVFRNNRTLVTGSAFDVLQDSAAVIENCLFAGNVANLGEDPIGVAGSGESFNAEHGSGALTIFPGSRVLVRRSTFTGNWNAVDDHTRGSVYLENIFWQNTRPGGISPGERYELDIRDARHVARNFIGGAIDDRQGTIDRQRNRLNAPDPRFDEQFIPRNPIYRSNGYRPVDASQLPPLFPDDLPETEVAWATD
ncbi:MAG: FG-GAP-like repeat-containing protein [Opitutales bacterium]